MSAESVEQTNRSGSQSDQRPEDPPKLPCALLGPNENNKIDKQISLCLFEQHPTCLVSYRNPRKVHDKPLSVPCKHLKISELGKGMCKKKPMDASGSRSRIMFGTSMR